MAQNRSTSQIAASSAVPQSSFSQRTFLGASISKIGLNAGFGTSTSTLSLNLIEDEYNIGDGTGRGLGQDPYHDGVRDNFTPPSVGSPVFFAMGPTTLQTIDNVDRDADRVAGDIANIGSFVSPTTEQSWKKTFDDLFDTSTTADQMPGYWDLTFGGLLQSYNQTRSSSGNPLFTAKVVDPREILSNVELILRDYAGTTFDNPNMFNLYGFLEYNGVPVDLDGYEEDLLTKTVDEEGVTTYTGTDMRHKGKKPTYVESLSWSGTAYGTPNQFPITGTGLSRIGPQGIPYYRVVQALNALGGLYGAVPKVYADGGFGGTINFRGYNYAIDLAGIPLIDQFYYLDYDKLNLLDFCQEICELISSELFVSLLPIIDHPATVGLYKYNQDATPEKMIHGLIKVQTINRKASQTPDAIRSYIEDVMYGSVTKSDVGVELSNVVTDKFVAGGQDVTNHFFSTIGDRTAQDAIELNKLSKMKEQQMIPFYGTLKSGAASIPRGIGSYQQILLNASNLNLVGVKDYYVATEMELRAASVSFESWRDFLMSYNDTYFESMELNDKLEGAALEAKPNVDNLGPVILSNNYAITVPRCMFVNENNDFGADGLPEDSCHPPYGYPLYYKRATAIGINLSGLAGMGQSYKAVTTSIANITGNSKGNDKEFLTCIRSEWQALQDLSQDWDGSTTTVEKEYFQVIEDLITALEDDPETVVKADVIGLLQTFASKLQVPQRVASKAADKSASNAQRVYKFVKDIAQKNLGKKFLVKLPNKVNTGWSEEITSIMINDDAVMKYGPFGFKPRSLNNDPRITVESLRETVAFDGVVRDMLKLNTPDTNTTMGGAFVNNYNPITSMRITNYKPNNNGGYWDYDLTNKINPQTNQSKLITQGLAPADFTPILKENGRVSCYVRFDNSQNMSFDRMNREKFVQQTTKGLMQIPDVNYQLKNNDTNKNLYLTPEDDQKNGPKSIAFVAADVAEQIYYAPKIENGIKTIYGNSPKDISNFSKPKRIFNCEDNKIYNSITYVTSDLRPTSEMGRGVNAEWSVDGDDLDGEDKYLDRDAAYALITIPNKVEATLDSRLQDGPMQVLNTHEIKHLMREDVVRGLDGFADQGIAVEPTDIQDEYNLDPVPLTVRRAIDQAKQAQTYAERNLAFIAPSPVYPNLICLPLQSSERCYGPWSSSLMNEATQEIGGDIEYEKDENLAPWNYSGYDLMNKAAMVKTQYSNSTLLQSERGSFSIPNAPSGIALGSYLSNQGPLITTINIDIGSNGIETAYVMDMYTSSFGKMQKQNSDAIAKIGRTRQQQLDKKNADLRKGLSRDQIDNTRAEAIEAMKDFSVEEAGVDLTPGYIDTNKSSVNTTVMTVKERREKAGFFDGDQPIEQQGEQVDSFYRSYTYSGGMTNESAAGDSASSMSESTDAKDFAHSADRATGDNQMSTSSPRSSSMASLGNKSQRMDKLYNDDIKPSTGWG